MRIHDDLAAVWPDGTTFFDDGSHFASVVPSVTARGAFSGHCGDIRSASDAQAHRAGQQFIKTQTKDRAMRKSILALTAVLAAATVAQSNPADARGMGGGFGIAFSPVFGRHTGPDPSILARAERMRHYQAARDRAAYSYERRREAAIAIAAARARAHQAAALAAAIKAEKKAAAALALRQSRIVVKQAAPVQIGNAAIAVPAVAAAGILAPATEDRQIEAAQQQQQAKAENLLKVLSTRAPAKVVAAPVSAPAAKAEVEVARPATSGECKRFIPAAGITITVPCSE